MHKKIVKITEVYGIQLKVQSRFPVGEQLYVGGPSILKLVTDAPGVSKKVGESRYAVSLAIDSMFTCQEVVEYLKELLKAFGCESTIEKTEEQHD